MTGSSVLDDEAQAVYLERFGERVVRVQETVAIAPRSLRRGRARDRRDVDLHQAGVRRFKQYTRVEHDRLLEFLIHVHPVPALTHSRLA